MRHARLREGARHAVPLLACALLAAACRPAGGAPAVVTIDLWALGREGEVVQALLPEFERTHPGIRVRVQQIPWTAAHEKLLTAYVGRSTPDIAQIGNTWIAEFAALDAIRPLDTLLAASSAIHAAAYFPGIWRTNVLDGVVYGIPWYVDTRLMFYRKDLLARAGYAQPPQSWSEWRRAMAAVKALGGPRGGRYAIFLPTNEWFQPVIFGLQNGSSILRDGGRYGAFRDTAFHRAFDFYLDLYRSGLAPVLGLNDIGNAYQEFSRGLFAMYITGPWNIGEFHRRLPPEMQNRWGTAPLPGPTGAGSGVSLAGGSSLVLFRGSRHPAEAWQVIEYLSGAAQQVRLYELSGDLPARTDAWRAAGLVTGEYTRAFWEQLQRVAPLPQVPEWELIATRVFDYAEQAIRGGESADTVLARLDREVDRILERRRQLLERRAAAAAGR